VYFFLVSYPILGAGLKYIDDAFDERTFNKKFALLLAPFLGILWAYTMIISSVSATILLAVLLGVFLKGKIDNYAHGFGLAVIVAILIITGVQLLLLPLIVLAAAAVLDEAGNDVIDYNRDNLEKSKFSNKVIIAFFDQRWVIKIAILYIASLGVFPWYFFLAILLFDGAYLGVRMYSRSRQPIQVGASA
jgi:cytochrome bd-type quinol oxidase subunit 2